MLLELRVARAWQVPPTKLRDWSQEDRNMAAALLVHESDIGPCGYPHRVTTDPELEGWIGLPDPDIDENAEPLICVTCAELEKHRESNQKPEPGELVRLVDRRHKMPSGAREHG